MATDLLLDNTGDMEIVNGDFVIGESSVQHIGLMLQSNKGDWAQNPSVGIGLVDMVNDDGSNSDMLATIKRELKKDGCNISTLTFNDATGSLVVDGSY